MSQILKGLVDGIALENKPLWWTPTSTVPTYQMKAQDTVVFVGVHTLNDDTAILYLPPTCEAVDKFYYICIPDVHNPGTTGDCSLTIKETATELATNGDMDADGDYILLYCDGLNWRTIVDGVS